MGAAFLFYHTDVALVCDVFSHNDATFVLLLQLFQNITALLRISHISAPLTLPCSGFTGSVW